MKQLLSIRKLSLFSMLFCIIVLAVAWYLQVVRGLDPCPLCAIQRAIYFASVLLFAIGAIVPFSGGVRKCFYAICLIVQMIGVTFAARHVYIQYLPKDQVPSCGADLAILLQNLPFIDAIKRVFRGSGDCATVHFRLIGLSIAQWSLICFGVLLLVAGWQMIRKN